MSVENYNKHQITFESKKCVDPADVVVFFGGKEVGDVTVSKFDAKILHAAINCGPDFMHSVLIQGFGPTREKAIDNAIRFGRERARKDAENIEDFAAVWAKMEYNSKREDHKLSARVKPGGKAY